MGSASGEYIPPPEVEATTKSSNESYISPGWPDALLLPPSSHSSATHHRVP